MFFWRFAFVDVLDHKPRVDVVIVWFGCKPQEYRIITSRGTSQQLLMSVDLSTSVGKVDLSASLKRPCIDFLVQAAPAAPAYISVQRLPQRASRSVPSCRVAAESVYHVQH